MNRSYSNHSGRVVAVDRLERTIMLEEVGGRHERSVRRRSFALGNCPFHGDVGDWLSVTAEHADGCSIARVIASTSSPALGAVPGNPGRLSMTRFAL
jgi:hypothetical protein